MPLENPIEKNRSSFEATEDSNVFVIMRFGEPGSALASIENAIRRTLNDFNLRAVLACDVLFDAELWANVRFCMDHCRYAIAVLDRIEKPEFNPNVTLELGYMLATKRPCLILKDKMIETLPDDIIGHLYWPFDSKNAANSVSAAVQKWLEHLGHTHIPSAETITAENNIDANKRRTRRILRELGRAEDAQKRGLIRQAASLSSLAISEKEAHEDRDYHKMILRERDAILRLLDDGWTVRIIICPEAQIDWVDLQLINGSYAEKTILPRYEQLLSIIRSHAANPRLQIAYTLYLPHQNLLVVGEEVVFIGRRLRRDTGFPYTTVIFDPAVIQDESTEFDVVFADSAGVLLQKQKPTAEQDFGSLDLKKKVAEKVQSCRQRLRRRLRRMRLNN